MVNSIEEFEIIVNQRIQEALDNTMQKLLDELINIVQVEVYNAYTPLAYDRTGQFKDSWEKTKTQLQQNISSCEIFQNYSTMVWNPNATPFPQHGTTSRPLAENELNNIIENGLGIPNFKRPFWTKFEQYVESNIYRIFKEECEKVGLTSI